MRVEIWPDGEVQTQAEKHMPLVVKPCRVCGALIAEDPASEDQHHDWHVGQESFRRGTVG